MAKAKIDKVGLVTMIVTFVVLGALYYFGMTTSWGAHLLNGYNILLLFYGFLSPLYILIRAGIVALRRKKAARLGLTYEAYEAQRRARLGLPPLGTPPLVDRWVDRLLRVARWELVTATVLLLVFGAIAQHVRRTPGEHPGVTVLGWLYALALYSLLGLQVLHRVWARWHHRLAPGSLPPAEPALSGKLSRAQVLWNWAFCLALFFAMVELGFTGAAELMAVLFAFVAPAVALLLLAGIWRMLRPLFRHRPAEPV